MAGVWYKSVNHGVKPPPRSVSGTTPKQGYLAHKKQQPPLGPPTGTRHRPNAGSQGEALSCERGTPVYAILVLGHGVSMLVSSLTTSVTVPGLKTCSAQSTEAFSPLSLSFSPETLLIPDSQYPSPATPNARASSEVMTDADPHQLNRKTVILSPKPQP